VKENQGTSGVLNILIGKNKKFLSLRNQKILAIITAEWHGDMPVVL